MRAIVLTMLRPLLRTASFFFVGNFLSDLVDGDRVDGDVVNGLLDDFIWSTSTTFGFDRLTEPAPVETFLNLDVKLFEMFVAVVVVVFFDVLVVDKAGLL